MPRVRINDEYSFVVFTGQSYKLGGEVAYPSPPPALPSQGFPSQAISSATMSQPTEQHSDSTVMVESSDDSQASTGTPLRIMSTYLAEDFSRCVERIRNVQLVLSSYAQKLQRKEYAEGFLERLERMHITNATHLSQLDASMARADARNMDEVEELLDEALELAGHSEEEFANFKANVLQFLDDDRVKTMTTCAMGTTGAMDTTGAMVTTEDGTTGAMGERSDMEDVSYLGEELVDLDLANHRSKRRRLYRKTSGSGLDD